jgi:hypothetical protein
VECLKRLNALVLTSICLKKFTYVLQISAGEEMLATFLHSVRIFSCLGTFSIKLIAICGACQNLYLPKEMSQDQLILNVTRDFFDVPGHRRKGYNSRSLGSLILFPILFIVYLRE